MGRFWCNDMRVNVVVMLVSLALQCSAFASEPILYRSTREREFREVMGALPSLLTGSGARVIDLDMAMPRQTYLGLGVSFPESSCHILMGLPAAERRAVLEKVFGKTGLGLSVGRIHCGSSDYSRHFYTYDDVPGDVGLENFSIKDDEPEVIPVIKEAMRINPDILFFSSTWSPPGWMKDNGSICGGHLLDGMIPAYADYLVKFFEAYQKMGIKIDAFTVQNEPQDEQAHNSPTCLVSAEQEMAIIREISPKLAAAGLTTKAWLYDHNFTGTNRVLTCLADEMARPRVGAVAWHPYRGQPEMIRSIVTQYPDVPMHVTEMGPHIDRMRRDVLWWGDLVLRCFNVGCSSFSSWCLALDEDGQPNVTRGFPCAGFVEINSETHEVTESEQFRFFRHVSPFVKRGAKVLDAPLVEGMAAAVKRPTGLDTLVYTAFRNPDGSCIVVLVCHDDDKFGRFQLQFKHRGLYLPVQVFSDSVTTVVFPAQ